MKTVLTSCHWRSASTRCIVDWKLTGLILLVSILNLSPSMSSSLTPVPGRQRKRFRRFLKKRTHQNLCVGSVDCRGLKASKSDVPESENRDYVHWTCFTVLTIIITILSIIVCKRSSPDLLLRGILFTEYALCTLPPFLPNWLLLFPILMHMTLQQRFEIAFGVGMVSWLASLDWKFACYRVKCWIQNSRDSTREYNHLPWWKGWALWPGFRRPKYPLAIDLYWTVWKPISCIYFDSIQWLQSTQLFWRDLAHKPKFSHLCSFMFLAVSASDTWLI